MKILTLILMMVISTSVLAEEINKTTIATTAQQSIFEIRADGLACPYCAYGIEKKFMAIDGVSHVDVALDKGLVKVSGSPSLEFNDAQLKTLFNDSGFTYRNMKKITIQK